MQIYQNAGLSPDETVRDRQEIKDELVSAYNTELKNLVQEELEEVTRQLRETEEPNPSTKWCTSWWSQFTVLLQRGLKERRHESFGTLRIIQIFMISILSGLLWFQSQGHVQDQVHMIVDFVFHYHPLYCQMMRQL